MSGQTAMRQILDRDEAEDSLGRQMLKLVRDYNIYIHFNFTQCYQQ